MKNGLKSGWPLALAALLMAAPAAAQNAGQFKLQTMFLEPENKCLEGNGVGPNAVLQGAAFMDDCQNVSGQLWTAVPEGNGYVRLKTQLHGDSKCLEGNRFAPGAMLQGAAFMDTCQNVSGQLWKVAGGSLVNGIPQPAGQVAMQPPVVVNQPPQMPSSVIIVNQLSAAPTIRLAPQDRVTLIQFVQRPDLRRAAPSIEIQSINFDTASAFIRPDQFDKVQQIAQALNSLLNSDVNARFLIEGHTDAVGSDDSNFVLSQQRAEALRNALLGNFGIPQHTLFTVGFGERDLVVPTQQAEWQNRRVTLRRIDQFVRP